MALNRQNIIRGPGIIRLGGGAAPWMNPMDDWSAEVDLKTFDLATNLTGPFDIRKDDQTAKISFTPLPLSNISDILFPLMFRHPDIGASVFGSTDVPCLCHSKAGKLVTFHCAAVTKPPDVFLSSTKAAFGPAEITAIVKNGSEPSADNSLYTISDAAMPAFSFSSADIVTSPVVGHWGTIFPTIITESGWTISIEPDIEFIQIDEAGTVDGLLKGVRVTAKCTPVNLTETQILSAMKLQNYARGGSLQPPMSEGENDLGIEYNGVTFELYRAGLLRGPLQYGAVKLRAGELAWTGAVNAGGGLFEVSA